MKKKILAFEVIVWFSGKLLRNVMRKLCD